ncbi:flagellar assembly protein FliH [Ornithinibacillus sp. 4-3]|uniref:Flagellar assembly protein FliH n=1 Tax=Ornithinibacillus sp. 4-3 TaxID=3231488 RepID=A0AB39HX38_9BACI
MVEVTTLLSSTPPYIDEKKKIKIKPIHQLQKVQNSETEVKSGSLKDTYEEQLKRLEQIKQEQADLLEKTNLDIEKQRSKWEAERSSLVEQAKQEGYSQGFDAGEKKGLAQYEALLDQANQIIAQTKADYDKMLDANDEVLVKLAMVSAEKILKIKLEEDPSLFLSIVKAVIKDSKDQVEISIFLHPENYKVVIEMREELSQTLDGDVKLSIYIDHHLNKHECLIKHPFGQVKAGIDPELKELQKILLEVVTEDK